MTLPEYEPPTSTVSPTGACQLEIHPAAKMQNGTSRDSAKSTYQVQDHPLGTTRHLRIVGIGAGASGLNLIRTLRQNLTNYTHVVYEKNPSVGGTWFENRYPGCRCDIPSHNYQFSWKPNHSWTNFCSPAAEIEDYLCRVCEEEDMGEHIKTEHKVTGAIWNEAKGGWELRVQDLVSGKEFNDFAHFLVDATGILNHWKWPDVPGLQDFKGDLIHSANWPKDFDYHNKVVAVIGNGSSGVQIVPAIRPDVKSLFHFVRSPTWIVPPRIPTMMMGPCRDILSQISLDKDENFTPETIERFKKEPEFYRKFVKTIEKDVNSNFRIFVKDSPMQAFAISKVREYMTAMLGGNEELCRALIPDFALGCRRMTPAPGYLECFQEPNVSLVTDNIARFVPEGIQTESGEIIKLDAIICATGFDLSFCPRFPIIGRDGNLQDKWTKETPKAYMSCAVAGMPNYFTFLGPNAPIPHGSVFTLSEHIAKYITSILKKCQTESIKSISPSQGAVDDFFEHITTFMPRTTWAGGCKSWFKNGTSNGPVTAVHPGSRIHFFHMLEQFRGEDWEYVYDDQAKGNRFSYLGNGFSTKELDEGFDSTWYLDEEGALGGYQIHALRKALL